MVWSSAFRLPCARSRPKPELRTSPTQTRRSSLGASRGAELLYGRASVQGKRDTSYSSRNATTGSTVAARREGKYDAAAVTISIRIATLVYTAGSIGLRSKSSVSI